MSDSVVVEAERERPKRIQLSRAKGWRLPEGAVVVSRPTKWGNPFDWRDWMDDAKACWGALPYHEDRKQWAREQAVESFAAALRTGELVLPISDLRGHDLACWCPSGPRYTCHADILLEIANG